MIKEKSKNKKKTMVFGMDEQLTDALLSRIHATGLSKSEIGRRALADYLEDGVNEPAVMFHLIELINELNVIKEHIPESNYKNIQNHMQNIMTIKGGK